MSKKQLDHLHTAGGLLACAALLCFPAGLPLSAFAFTLQALISGFIALTLAHFLLKLGALPSILRIGVLYPLAFSAPLILLVLPHPLVVLWLLLPYALILLSLRPYFKSLSSFWTSLAFLICLSLGSARWLQLLTTQAHYGMPYLPNHLLIWLGILAVIPLGVASRPVLMPLAKGIARYQIWVGLFLLGLYPLIWCTATTFKIPGESARNFHPFSPEPRFFLLPRDEMPAYVPSELQDDPLQHEILRTLNEMTWRLSDMYLTTTFTQSEDLPPAEMLRAMKLYGFLIEDRYGAFLPGESFTKSAPKEMDPHYLESFRNSMAKVVLTPQQASKILHIPITKMLEVFAHLQKLNWVREVPGEDFRYRLTSQARQPFASGLYPRQILLLEQTRPNRPVEMVQSNYVPRRQLTSNQILNEFDQLEAFGAAETRQVWRWNQHIPFLLHPEIWKQTALLVLSAILALLAGRCLPDNLPKFTQKLMIIAGLLLSLQLPVAVILQPALRIGLGLWLLRNLLPLSDPACDRISLFAACGFITTTLMPLPNQTLLVHQCAWILIWTLPAILCLTFAIRPPPQNIHLILQAEH